MRNVLAGADARACRERQTRDRRDLLERKGVELRHNLAFEPGLVTPARMLAGPAAIATMAFANRSASGAQTAAGDDPRRIMCRRAGIEQACGECS